MQYDCSTGRGNKNYDLIDHRVTHSIEQDEIDKRFHILETIGEGTYGMVYKAIDLTTNKVRSSSFLTVFLNFFL
jgi:serine/threonine protein kinase